jgi:hypothetical protein
MATDPDRACDIGYTSRACPEEAHRHGVAAAINDRAAADGPYLNLAALTDAVQGDLLEVVGAPVPQVAGRLY